MKIKNLAVTLAAATLLLTGCWQKSLHPFCKESDVIFEEELLGEWRDQKEDPKDSSTWTFAKSEIAKVYKVNIDSGDTKMELDGRLFKLGDARFMDMHSRARPINEIPAHHLFRVVQTTPTLKMQILSIDWVKKWVGQHPNDIATIASVDPEHPDDADKTERVLTADTERLQKFVRDHMNDEGFFEEPFELKKAN